MDSITQIVVGIATVEALVGKKLKNKTFLVGAILGTLPDLDIYIGKLFSYEMELAFHRAFTHSFLGILIISPLLALLLQKILPHLSFKRWTLVTAFTMFTHILIDLFTSWGVQLFYPYEERFSFKTIFVVDIFYTLPWIVGLIFVFKNKLPEQRKHFLKWGFLISSCYLMLTVALKLFVCSRVENHLQDTKLSGEFIVKPTFSNCILWNINLKDSRGYSIGQYSLFDSRAFSFSENYFQRNLETEIKFKNDAVVQQLIQVSEGWYLIDKVDESTYIFNDLRFGFVEKENASIQFAFSYQIKLEEGKTMVTPLPKTLRDGKATLRKTWQRLKGN